ncbi:hypothetical protein [Streptomyces syringium]|uniref:hypothetical protein n=1 Tax=Streptomyces syringium TaxID=76729 RepID=UPI0033FE34A2
MTTSSPLWDRAELWLLSREIYPRGGRENWAQGAPALVQVGIHFDVVQVPAAVVEACAGVPYQREIKAVFREVGITSSVIVSRLRDWYYFLVPPGTDCTWREKWANCLGQEDAAPYVSVPHPRRANPPGTYWLLRAPDGPDMLCNPDRVRDLARRAPVARREQGA